MDENQYRAPQSERLETPPKVKAMRPAIFWLAVAFIVIGVFGLLWLLRIGA